MMFRSGFKEWLATYFDEKPEEVEKFLKNSFAVEFLVTWTIFESKLFGGYLRKDGIKPFCEKIGDYLDSCLELSKTARYFHTRFQDDERRKNLLYKDKDEKFLAYLGKEFEELELDERLYVLIFSTFRYRNNIFHGNKGVTSWLQYSCQIEKCTKVMQSLVNAYENEDL